MVATVVQERPPAINAVFGDCEEEILGVHMLINEMHTPLLMCHALAFTPFNKT